jgi:hypothetical protein
MISNPNLTAAYGSGSNRFYNTPPSPYKPSPTINDYAVGYIYRSFIVKHSDNTGYEINPTTAGQVNNSIYTICQIVWRISGKAYYTKSGNIIDDQGISPQNLQQIADNKINTGISLTPFLPNPLEYWKGS